MKIGINNIFYSFWFIVMLLSSGFLTYLSFDKNLFTGEFILVGKIVMGLMVILFIAVLFYLLYKFRIVFIKENTLISITPFLFKTQKIGFDKTLNLKWSNWTGAQGTIYRLVEFKADKMKISISDMEFENFDFLTSSFAKSDNNEKREVDLIQAEGNISSMKFNVYLFSAFLIFLIGNTILNSGFHLMIILFLLIDILLIYASYQRKIKYDRIIKTFYNTK